MSKTNNRRSLGRVLAMAMALCLALLVILPMGVNAVTENDAVKNVSNSVMQVNLYFQSDLGEIEPIGYGSGFLINPTTLVTNYHVIAAKESTVALLAEAYGLSMKQVMDRVKVSATITRDVTVPCTILDSATSAEMDFATLRLSTPLNGREPVSVRSSQTLAQTEVIYAVGFPSLSDMRQSVSTFTSADTTITAGFVTKVGQGSNLLSGAQTDYIQTSCQMFPGNSGGPLVDENGFVVGICQGSFWEDDSTESEKFYNAITIDQATEVWDALGIEYTKAGTAPSTAVDYAGLDAAIAEASAINGANFTPESYAALTAALSDATAAKAANDQAIVDGAAAALRAAITGLVPATSDVTVPTLPPVNTTTLDGLISEAEGKKEADYSEDTFKALKDALTEAKNAKTSEDQAVVNAAADKLSKAISDLEAPKAGPNILLFVIIGVVVLIVVVVVIVVVMSSGKKKAAANNHPAARPTPAPVPGNTGAIPGGFVPPVTVPAAPVHAPAPAPASGAGETTVLNQGAGETTVLAAKVNGGTLVRSRNGERINISSAEFSIGRERKNVSYCISDNTSVSRVHVKLIVRNGNTYLQAQNTANGTFLNGVKAVPMQEVALKNGDKVTLSDEEFVFQA